MMAANFEPPITTMADLNHECLYEILSYIDVRERMKFREVSKKFCDAADACWERVKVVTISYTADAGKSARRSNNDTNVVENCISGFGIHVTINASSTKLIKEVLERCGKFIIHIYEKRSPRMNSSFMNNALDYCPQIRYLDVHVITQQDDENMSHLFAKIKKLEWLLLRFNSNKANKCFDAVPTDYLQSLRFMAWQLDNPSIELLNGQKRLLRRCDKTLITVVTADYIDDELLELTADMINLKRLQVGFCHIRGVTERGINHLLKLRNLETLILRFKTIPSYPHELLRLHDGFVMALKDNMPLLKHLEIYVARRITNEGFKSLASLEKLKILVLDDSPSITSEYLVLFSHLETLKLRYFREISDCGVIELLKKAETMRRLRLDRTKITNKTLEAAVEATKRRTNRIALTLSVAGTDTTPMEYQGKSPLLTIISK